MDVYTVLAEVLAQGRAAVLVTVVAVDGDPPSRPGAKLLVVDGAVAAGTIGCSEFDAAGVALAGDVVESTLRRRVVFGHGQEQVLELFAERHDPTPGVVVIGSTPVGRCVADLAERLGRRVIYLPDDVGPTDVLRVSPPGPHDAVVVSDHDAAYVDDVVRLALGSPAFFVGMLGSRRHGPAVLDRLRGTPGLERLHTPIGLDIGGRTPAEIALSIMAEIVAVQHGRPGGSLSKGGSLSEG